MTDTRRVCDLNAAELFEAAIHASGLATAGRCEFVAHIDAGRLRRLVRHEVIRSVRVDLGAPVPESFEVEVERADLTTG